MYMFSRNENSRPRLSQVRARVGQTDRQTRPNASQIVLMGGNKRSVGPNDDRDDIPAVMTE